MNNKFQKAFLTANVPTTTPSMMNKVKGANTGKINYMFVKLKAQCVDKKLMIKNIFHL